MRVVGIVLSALAVVAFAGPVHAQGSETLQAPNADGTAAGESTETSSAPPARTSPAEPAPAGNLGGAGESCRARSDCASGLRCITNVCRDPLEGTECGASSECGPNLRCYQQTCQSPTTRFARAADAARIVEGGDAGEEEVLTLRGVHWFIGASLMIGPTLYNHQLYGTLLLGLRGGLIVSGNEIALEVTPFSSFYGMELPVFQLNATYGYLIPVMRARNIAVYWPMRAGAGFLVGNTAGWYVEARADVLGIALQVDQVMIDLHFPSFRIAWTPSSNYYYYSGISSALMMHWYAGASVSYLF